MVDYDKLGQIVKTTMTENNVGIKKIMQDLGINYYSLKAIIDKGQIRCNFERFINLLEYLGLDAIDTIQKCRK
ncbi:MAG: hypothetical protein WBO70_01650 [Erysipelotrichaceae bacterium]